jgi:hypothetical protein
MVLVVTRTASTGWSPTGAAFFVEDQEGTSLTSTYLYEADSLQRLDVGQRILTTDAEARQFATGHYYFTVDRWLDADKILISFNGHTDHPPVTCFEFRYQVSRKGEVRRISQRTGSPYAPWCQF